MQLFGEEIGYKAEYLSGHGAFPERMKCRVVLLKDDVEIPQMPLTIPYARIQSVQSMT